jgi:hypothetical protein
MTREQVIVYHKNPYSLSGFELGTSGFVVRPLDQLTINTQTVILTSI